MSVIRPIVLALVALLVFNATALAVEPDEMLQDPALEARAREISEQLRCVVCQNQTIDDSNAPLAHDMRLLVRERLLAGDSDKAAIDFIVARYGNFVLLKPPMQADTLALWAAPFIVLALLTLGLFGHARAGSRDGATARLSADEERQLNELLSGAARNVRRKGEA